MARLIFSTLHAQDTQPGVANATSVNVLKTTAEYYRRGLMSGLMPTTEAMAWIDGVLLAVPVPEIALIEASLSGSHGSTAVADRLAQVSGEFDGVMATRYLLGRMLITVDQNPAQFPAIASLLYQMAMDDDWPEIEGEEQMWTFEDDFYLAADGVYGDVVEIREALRALLVRAFLLSTEAEQDTPPYFRALVERIRRGEEV